MPSYYKMYGGLAALITGACVSMSNRIEWFQTVLGLNNGVVLLLSILFGGFAPALILKALLKSSIVRQRIQGQSWIEGWWLLLTYTADRTNEYQGFLEIRWDSDLRLRALAYFSEPHLDKLTAESIYLTFDPISMQYINYSTVFDIPTFQAIAFGRMYLDQHSRYPTLYHGRRVEIDNQTRSPTAGSIPTWQDMAKIEPRVVTDFQAKYGIHWKRELLNSREHMDPLYTRASRKKREFFESPGGAQIQETRFIPDQHQAEKKD